MPTKKLKICERGHKFYKSSDCQSCPICALENKPESGFLSLLSAPARGALVHAAISTLTELSKYSEQELNLHGVGPKTLPILRQALRDAGLAFAPQSKRAGREPYFIHLLPWGISKTKLMNENGRGPGLAQFTI